MYTPVIKKKTSNNIFYFCLFMTRYLLHIVEHPVVRNGLPLLVSPLHHLGLTVGHEVQHVVLVDGLPCRLDHLGPAGSHEVEHVIGVARDLDTTARLGVDHLAFGASFGDHRHGDLDTTARLGVDHLAFGAGLDHHRHGNLDTTAGQRVEHLAFGASLGHIDGLALIRPPHHLGFAVGREVKRIFGGFLGHRFLNFGLTIGREVKRVHFLIHCLQYFFFKKKKRNLDDVFTRTGGVQGGTGLASIPVRLVRLTDVIDVVLGARTHGHMFHRTNLH
jgi:hypothetical protein